MTAGSAVPHGTLGSANGLSVYILRHPALVPDAAAGGSRVERHPDVAELTGRAAFGHARPRRVVVR